VCCFPATAEAEPTEAFKYSFTLEAPLAPRTVNFTQTGEKITLHMYTFNMAGRGSSSDCHLQQQQQQQDDALLSLLNMAVGAKQRCAAVPGITSSSGSSSSSMEFGVLLWEQLPAGQQLSWPVWTHQEQQQQPYVVSMLMYIVLLP
jgi:hypothetical protein